MNQWLVILICETVAITIIGSLLHFTYGWSGKNKFVGIFSAVNESTWEHTKLALSGILACTLVDLWFLGDNPNYWLARNLSFLMAIIVIPLLFYGYHGFTKKRSILPLDILIFVIVALISSAVFVMVLSVKPVGEVGGIIAIVTGVAILAAYLLLTKFPFRNNFLFEDPITHTYGFDEKKYRVKTPKRVLKKVDRNKNKRPRR